MALSRCFYISLDLWIHWRAKIGALAPIECQCHKIPQDYSFFKSFSPVIYIQSIFARDTHKGQTYGHNWSSHNAHYGQNGHYGRYGSTNYGHKFDLYGCPWNIWSKCRSPVKTVLKKIHPTEFYGQNKKMCEKWPFLGDFLCK